MFGIGFSEIIVVMIVAVIFLGPDKLPNAVVEVMKFIKALRRSLDDAKANLEKEIKLEELKKSTLNFKETLTNPLSIVSNSVDSATNPFQKEFKDLEEDLHLDSYSKRVLEDAKTTKTPRTKANTSKKSSHKDVNSKSTNPIAKSAESAYLESLHFKSFEDGFDADIKAREELLKKELSKVNTKRKTTKTTKETTKALKIESSKNTTNTTHTRAKSASPKTTKATKTTKASPKASSKELG